MRFDVMLCELKRTLVNLHLHVSLLLDPHPARFDAKSSFECRDEFETLSSGLVQLVYKYIVIVIQCPVVTSSRYKG